MGCLGHYTTELCLGRDGHRPAVMPFFATTGSLVDIVRNSTILAAIAGVYYWRAKTEEKHLGADPAYRLYSAWMERNAPLPRLVRKLKGGPRPEAVPAE